jgi:putative addiction module antidote
MGAFHASPGMMSALGQNWQASPHAIITFMSMQLEVAMLALKLRKVGTSIGLVLPKEMLRRLHAKEGQEIFAIETPTGYALTTLDPRVREQVERGETLMDRYRDVFAALAK